MDQAPELSRRQTLVGGLTLATGLTAYSASASAQTYPDRPVKAIVPYSPGSGADVTARLTLGYLATELKQSVVIENRPGAGAIAGTQAVAQAAPNGYTILFCATQHAINPSAQESLPYDTQKDFIAVARVTTQPLFLAVPASLPVNSVAELIAFLKASPGKYNYGSTGLGTSIHLAGAYFAAQAGLSMTHVPYKDAGQCIMDLARHLLYLPATRGPVGGEEDQVAGQHRQCTLKLGARNSHNGRGGHEGLRHACMAWRFPTGEYPGAHRQDPGAGAGESGRRPRLQSVAAAHRH